MPSLIKIGLLVLEEKIFFFIYQCISTFLLLSPLGNGRSSSFVQFFLIPFTQECFLPSLVEIGPVVLEKKIFFIFQGIFTFSLLSPLGNDWWSSFEQIWIPFPQGLFGSNLIEIGPVVLEKKIFFNISDFLLNKREFPSPKDASYQVWLKLAQWFWRRSWKCKSLNSQTMDKRRLEKLTWAFSSGELKTKLQPLGSWNSQFW